MEESDVLTNLGSRSAFGEASGPVVGSAIYSFCRFNVWRFHDQNVVDGRIGRFDQPRIEVSLRRGVGFGSWFDIRNSSETKTLIFILTLLPGCLIRQLGPPVWVQRITGRQRFASPRSSGIDGKRNVLNDWLHFQKDRP